MGVVTRQTDFLWPLTNVGDETPWLDLSDNTESWSYTIDIVGAGDTIEVRASEQRSVVKTKYDVIDIWTSDSFRRRMPRDSGSFVKFVKTAGTNGFVSTVGTGRYINSDRVPCDITGQANAS